MSKHGGGARAVKAKAAIRAEVLNWGLGDAQADLEESYSDSSLKSAARAQRYASELEQLIDDEGLAAAMVGEIEISDEAWGLQGW